MLKSLILGKTIPLEKERKDISSYYEDKGGFTRTAFPIFVTDSGLIFDPQARSCHGACSRVNRNDLKIFANKILKQHDVYTVCNGNTRSVYGKFENEDESKRLFIEWLTNFSVWRNTFLLQDVSQIKKDGFFIQETDVPSNLMITGGIATRFLSERHYATETWFKLIKAGIKPELAFMLSIPLYIRAEVDENDKFKYMYISEHYPYDHISVPYYSDKREVLSNVYNQKTVHLTSSYRSTGTYQDLMAMHGETGGVDIRNSIIYNFIKSNHEYVDGPSKSISPFRKEAENQRKKVHYEKTLANIIKNISQLEKEIKDG